MRLSPSRLKFKDCILPVLADPLLQRKQRAVNFCDTDSAFVYSRCKAILYLFPFSTPSLKDFATQSDLMILSSIRILAHQNCKQSLALITFLIFSNFFKSKNCIKSFLFKTFKTHLKTKLRDQEKAASFAQKLFIYRFSW